MEPNFETGVREAISILLADGATEDEIESKVLAETGDPMLARRLIVWIPEAFGLVLISHMNEIGVPNMFSAKSGRGEWRRFPFTKEPIFVCAFRIAQQMYHDGPRNCFEPLAARSSMVAAVNKALHRGASLKGAQLSGPALIGIPAEVYEPSQPSFWRRLFSRRA